MDDESKNSSRRARSSDDQQISYSDTLKGHINDFVEKIPAFMGLSEILDSEESIDSSKKSSRGIAIGRSNLLAKCRALNVNPDSAGQFKTFIKHIIL